MPSHHRKCGTPGCRFRDAHDGPHSHERFPVACRGRTRCRTMVCKGKRLETKATEHRRNEAKRSTAVLCSSPTRSVVCVRAPNDFQLGIDDVRTAIDAQQGVRLRMPKTTFSGHWPGAKDVCTGKLLGASYEGRFVAEAHFDGDDAPTLLTSASLMLAETHVTWRKPNLDASVLLRNKCAANPKHTNAMGRAAEMYEVLLRDCDVDLRGRLVVTLDGIGTNRVAGDAILEAVPPHERPDILTLEMNADVALAQRVCLGFGNKVRFTGADPTMARRKLKKSGPPTIEDVLVTSDNAVLSEEEKRRTVWLNLDYCGGPPKSKRVEECAAVMQECLAHLPHLQMVTVTMARRNHADLDATFGDYFPTPYGFYVANTYTSNGRVLCKHYLRDRGIARHVSIPGRWWTNASSACKKTDVFDGIVVGHCGDGQDDMLEVYVPYDNARYKMRGDAVSAYAVV